MGRSNVGKSSLIGALLEDKKLVRVSKTPGRTRDTLFFAIGDRTRLHYPLLLVDLPGYGYARAGKSDIRTWTRRMERYLSERGAYHLKRCFLLIDARRGILDVDIEVVNFLEENGCKYQLVLTKTDSISVSALNRVASDTVTFMSTRHPQLCSSIVYGASSKRNEGLEEIRSAILYAAAESSE